MSVPTGLTVSGSPITTSGTLAVTLTAGYSIPTTANQSTWTTAYNRSLTSAAVTGTTTKTLTLNQQDGGTITASWTDYDTAPVTSVFGRTGAVVATEGDYTLTQLGDVTITSPTSGQVLKYNGTTWINDTDANTGTVTSVAMTVPTGLSIAGSPITSSGTLAVTFASGYSIPTNASQTTWDTAYTNRITSLTTTGTSGAATLTSNVLNIPQYQAALTNPITGTGTSGQVAYFNGTTSITSEADFFWDSTNNRLGIGTNDPQSSIHIIEPTAARIRLRTGATGAALVDFYNDTTARWSIGVDNNQTYGKLENRVLSVDAIRFYDSSNNLVLVPTSGVVGVGITPSAWISTVKALQINGGSMYASTNYNFIGNNVVYSSTGDKYINIGYATAYGQTSGEHRWYIAPEGVAAGDAITFTRPMTINTSGNLLVGTEVSTNHKLTVYNATSASQVRVAGAAPSVVFTDTVTDPATYVGYMGMATAANNFMTGSAAGDYIFHNYSGGAMLFGINNSVKVSISSGGIVKIADLAGTGNRMVIASSTGVLSTQAIPSGTVTSVGLSSATSGVTIGATPITTSGTITIAISTATNSQNGLLSSTDWTLFNGKQGTITLTTTGTSGAATFSSNTLNIPNYGSALSGYLPLTGGTLTGPLGGTSAVFSSALSAYTLTAVNQIKGSSYVELSPDQTTYNAWNIRVGAQAADACYFITGGGVNILTTEGYNNPYTVKLYSNAVQTLTMTNGVSTFSNNVYIGTTDAAGKSLVINGTGATSGTIYFDSTGKTFGLYQTGTQKNYLSASLGVGTDSPYSTAKLQVRTATNINIAVQTGTLDSTGIKLNAFNDAGSANIPLEINGSTLYFKTLETERMKITSTGFVQVTNTSQTDSLGLLQVTNSTASATASSNAGITANSYNGTGQFMMWENKGMRIGNRVISNTGAGGVYFTYAADSVGLTITSTGNILIGAGVTDVGSLIHAYTADNRDNMVYTNANASLTYAIFAAKTSRAGGTSCYFYYGEANSVTTYRVYNNGNVQNTNNSYGGISDISLKSNILDATPKLEDLLKVRIVNYNLKGSEDKQIGVIAQELEKIFPNMIDIDGNTKLKSVKYSVFVPMLIKAVQELKQEIETLKNK